MKNSLENFNYFKYLFLVFLITAEVFSELTLKEIINEFPLLNELFPLINELGLRDYIDNRGN